MSLPDETPDTATLLKLVEKLSKDFNTSAATLNEKALLNILTYTLQNVKKLEEANKDLKYKLIGATWKE